MRRRQPDREASRAGATSAPSAARRRAREDRLPHCGRDGERRRRRSCAGVDGAGAGVAASGGSWASIRAATASSVEASSRRSRNATFTPKVLWIAVLAWVRNSESRPSSRKETLASSSDSCEARQLGEERLQSCCDVGSTRGCWYGFDRHRLVHRSPRQRPAPIRRFRRPRAPEAGGLPLGCRRTVGSTQYRFRSKG